MFLRTPGWRPLMEGGWLGPRADLDAAENRTQAVQRVGCLRLDSVIWDISSVQNTRMGRSDGKAIAWYADIARSGHISGPGR
jgi:hypothetical protein